MKILFIEPLVLYPTKKHDNGKRSDLGIRWSVAYLCGVLEKRFSSVEFTYLSYRLDVLEGKQINIREDVIGFDVVCVGACTNEIPHTLHICDIAKQEGAITILGGLFPSANPNYLMNTRVVDYVVIGEAEETFYELVRCLINKVKPDKVSGLAMSENGKVIFTPARLAQSNIDIYTPLFEILPLDKYRELNLGTLYTARGCSYQCSFCTVSPHWGKQTRYHSDEYVLDMLEKYSDIGFHRVHFIDEAFTANRDRAIRLFRKIKEKNFPFYYKIKSRLSDLDLELLRVLKEAGVRIIQCGIETFDYEKVPFSKGRSYFGRKRDAIKKVIDLGFKLNLIYQLGFPGMEYDDLQNDKEEIILSGKNSSVLTFVGFNTPHPFESMKMENKRDYTVLSGDLNYYDHKKIVSVPHSLGRTEYALKLIQDAYNEIVDELNNEDVNPKFSLDYITSNNAKLQHIENFFSKWPGNHIN